MLEAKFEHIDVQEEEQKLLLIQKTLLKVIRQFSLSEDVEFMIVRYLMQVMKKKTVEDIEAYHTVQFGDSTKKNMHKLLYHIMDRCGQ